MLRLRGAALALAVAVAACGETSPLELRTIAPDPPAAVVARPLRAPAESTTTTTAPPPPPTTSTTAPPPPPATTTTTGHPAAVQAAQAGSGDGCLGWRSTMAAHFPAEQVPTACRVMVCETGGTGDPTIHNPSSSASGLFQFLDSTWADVTGLAPPAAAYPAGRQVAAAAALWASSGWSPWSCY